RLVAVGFVAQLWVLATGVVERLRVGDDDIGAQALQTHRDIERGRVADVVAVRLECGAEHSDALAHDTIAKRVLHEVDSAVAAAQIDLIHLAQERHRFTPAQLLGAGNEGADVFGEASAAKTDPGPEEAATD